ncbi:hypothetical protein GCK72_004323 [Caenorhabditis remanei]|uniref:DUF38 domain-containing protein n=1 Tax=Caenorhabditis remanei TaxID=31234 RepID=A0A6A5HC14_CAERE|nr:hypothetical protein GCK72_004323 [Caenorhabditis remanei]KAF1764376.1 hypothetical protein GCK72_004323 [Caenorhabditis remanei]
MSRTSRNKNLLLSTPYVFQRQLSDFLCLETRLNLRKCSKRCQLLIDSLPLTLKTFHIYTTDGVVTLKYSEPKTETYHGIEYRMDLLTDAFSHIFLGNTECVTRGCMATKVVEDIEIILSNPELKIENLCLTINPEHIKSFQALFLQRMELMISSLPHQINAQKIYLRGPVFRKDYHLLLSRLNAEKLQLVNLTCEMSNDSLHRISRLEQIKKVPEIFILNSFNRFPFNLLSNTSRLDISVRDISQSEFNLILEYYLQQTNFKMAHITVDKNKLEPWVTEFLLQNDALEKDDGMIVSVEGPKFKNTVEISNHFVVIKRSI